MNDKLTKKQFLLLLKNTIDSYKREDEHILRDGEVALSFDPTVTLSNGVVVYLLCMKEVVDSVSYATNWKAFSQGVVIYENLNSDECEKISILYIKKVKEIRDSKYNRLFDEYHN